MSHFALSELLIVVVGLWAARRLYGAGRGAAALALILFSAAAGIGVIRFGLDRDGALIAALADIHRFAGTLGGTAAMMALVYDLLQRRAPNPVWQGRYMAACAIALALALAFPVLSVPFFIWWSVAFIGLAAILADRLGPASGMTPFMAMSIAGLMLVNAVVFRQASWLSVSMSWHIFHVLVAVWAFGLAHLLAAAPNRSAA
ncbi:MAG: hypothetical protein L7V29_02395 [Alphaproteobacteria bacterium]|nr:hypothetical protein [Alphaproteobacteria bacterium]